ncbi:MAG: GGDEF domain-containing protein [Lysobacterales bacterium 14-68-21]|jgi:diguanylate cyclase (GGDEF)-like protein|nr:MAG: GGDEF domain-containing protein [Xanthomonadales bacterium 15-68-25]OZB63765.1 MAG: GGDEF domain-containing protein [Xanthomonadales bacterium 14-68-21]
MSNSRLPSRFLWLAALALCGLLAGAQVCAQQFSVQYYGRKSGLESQTVNAMLQDRRGFIWVGTEMGLYRFDGASFHRMGPAEGFAAGEFVNAIAEGPSGRLWIATQSGLRVGDGLEFRPVEPGGRSLVPDAGRRLIALPGDAVLLVRGGHLLEVAADGQGGWRVGERFTAAQRQAWPGLQDVSAVQMVDGTLWLGCGRRVCQVHGSDVRVYGPADGVPEDVWSGIFRDRRGTLWLRGTHVLRARPPGATRFVSRDVPGEAMDILTDDIGVTEDPQGHILTRTDRGLARWDGSRWTVFDAANGLPDVGITALMFDRDGDLWLGTYGRGVALWNGYGVIEGWSRAQGMDTAPNWSIARDARGRMWFANEMGGNVWVPGASRIDPWPLDARPPPRQNLSMQAGPDGAMWVASYDGRLFRYDGQGTRLVATLPWFIKAIRFDRGGRLWIATMKGVFSLAPGDDVPRLAEGAPATQCSDIAESAPGALWFACQAGLLRFADGRWTLLAAHGDIAPGGYIAVAAAADGTLWLGANEPGLFRGEVRGDSVQLQRVADRWLDNTLAYFVRLDRRGWLWVGGSAGVDVFDGHRWVHVSQDAGLLWDETDQNAFFEDADGSIWIGSAIGVSHIRDPQALFRGHPHRVVLTSVTVGERRLAQGEAISMGGRRAPLVLRFARLGAASGSLPRYRYRLRGTGTGTVETTANEVVVSALPAGDYRFEIQVIDDDLRMLSPVTTFEFHVRPAWWLRWWALSIWGLAAAMLVALAWRWRVRALLRRNLWLDTMVRQRTRELRREKGELEQARARLYVQARFDELTGLLNRRAILEQLAGVLADDLRRSRGVAVVLIDLDHFKNVNDNYGHQVGDEVLHAVAQCLLRQLRPHDCLGRYGGEELLLVMEGIGAREAQQRLDAMREAVAALPLGPPDCPLHVTISLGLAWAGTAQTDTQAIVRDADEALYKAKQSGRNRLAMAASAA